MDLITLALAKKHADQLALGGYTNVTAVENQVRFTMHDGTVVTVTLPLPEDGVSVENLDIRNSHLFCMLSDGTEIDAGELPSGSLKEKIVVSNPVGSATAGKEYDVNTPFETLLHDILVKEETPVVAITLTPSRTLYDKVTETLDAVSIKTVATKKTYEIKDIKIFIDDVLVKTFTDGVATGGIFNFAFTYPSPINTDSVIKVVATDVKNLASTKTTAIKFVGKTYYGYIDSNLGSPTEAQIKALQNFTLKDVKGFKYNDISFDYNKVVYAYPASFGDLESIKDVENNINYTNSFTKTNVTVDEITYVCYTQNDASQAVAINLTFA